MGKRDVTRFGVLVAVVIVLAILVSFTLLLFGNRNPEIVLPPVSTAATETDQPVFSDGDFQLVEVTPQTVQNVIATLNRPTSYMRTVTVEQFWPDLNGVNGVSSAQATSLVRVDGRWTRTDLTLPGGQVRCTIVEAPEDGAEPGRLWRWEEGRSVWYAGASDGWDADLSQWCPTYEDVLALPADSITGAGYEKVNDAACILAEVSDPELGYTRKFWVSVESGLLMAAEIWDGSQLLYRMNGTQSAVLSDDDGAFALPDGTVLHQPEVIDQEIGPVQG